MKTVLLRINSHRAREKFERLGIKRNVLASFYHGYFYEVSENDTESALKITGIKLAKKPKSMLHICSYLNQSHEDCFQIKPSNYLCKNG